MDRDDLEQVAHLVGAGQPRKRALDLGRPVGIGLGQRLRARLDAEAPEPRALCD